jgi:hypothetical protein
MTKNELITQLESAKSLTSVVSIDNVIALIQGLDPEVVTKTELRMTQSMFDAINDVIETAINNMDADDMVDMDSAEFEMDYNNTVRLSNVGIDGDNIFDVIRYSLDRNFDIVEDEDDNCGPSETEVMQSVNEGLGLDDTPTSH